MSKHHVIIGGGPAATNAMETIRQFEEERPPEERSKITLISDEPAHSRMALPYWLSGQIVKQATQTADDAYFEKLQVQTYIGQTVSRIDPENKSVMLDDDQAITYDDLLIATGASPLELSFPGSDLPGVLPLWKLSHTQTVLDATARVAQSRVDQPRVVMVGSGFIGFIMLNAMLKRNWNLTVIERESHLLPRMMNVESAAIAENWLQQKNVDFHCGTTVKEIRQTDDGSKEVELANGTKIAADLVIIAIGVRANLELAKDADIETDQGILVNDSLQTNFSEIYAAGDVAQGKMLFNDQKQVHAIHPTAVDHGRVVGANMAGQKVKYPGSLLMNVLDISGLQCASYGNWLDDSAEMMTINNPTDNIYRTLMWTGNRLTGCIFVGQANDVGMLTDIGMVKGIMQTGVDLSDWKSYLAENPFDIRRVYVARNVASELIKTQLTGRPAAARKYRYAGQSVENEPTPANKIYVGTKQL